VKPFRTGLVVGKFCPLHRGHEIVIHRAVELCDEVVVVSYTRPEFVGCEPEKRERWLAIRFPTTHRLVVTEDRLRVWFTGGGATAPALPVNSDNDTTHRRFVGRLCLEVLHRRVDAVFTSETYGDGFAAEMTAHFAERGDDGPAVVHHLVDLDRNAAPISGERLRQDPHAGRAFLAPEVYASFVQRVALLGAESSGKSALAQALASAFATKHVAEYGRERWEIKQGLLAFDDLLEIAEIQCAREDEAAGQANRFLFCDTTPLTTLFYSERLFGRAAPRLRVLADRRYAQAVLCAPDFPFVQDGTREGPALQPVQHAWYLHALARRGAVPLTAEGSLAARVTKIRAHLQSIPY